MLLSGSNSMKPPYTEGRLRQRTMAGTSSGSMALSITFSLCIMLSSPNREFSDRGDHRVGLRTLHVGEERKADQPIADIVGHRALAEPAEPLGAGGPMKGLVMENRQDAASPQMSDQLVA